MNAAGTIGRRRLEKELKRQQSQAIAAMQPAVDAYASTLKDACQHISEFGAASTLQLLGRLSPDVVICLGGVPYPRSFIEACPLVLNYHSGFSPVYNGTSAIWFAFANGHPQWSGGTLMVMSTVIDGGDILTHYLPAISPTDDPFTLFQKTALGSAIAYDRFLSDLKSSGRSFAKAPQPNPLFYCRSRDWTPVHTARVRRNVKRQLCSGFTREESLVEYWREPSDAAAVAAVQRTTSRLMWGQG